MKYKIILLSLLVFSSCKEESHTKTTPTEKIELKEDSLSLTGDYIEGEWRLTTTPMVIDGGMTIAEEGIITFFSSGKVSTNTSLRCYANETEEDIFSYSGVDTGTWRVEKGKLILNYTSMDINNLKSSIPMVNKEALLEEIKDSLGKDETLQVLTLSKDSLKLIEGEEEIIYHYNRTKG